MACYKGVVPCPGCGRSGLAGARDKKESLCYRCKDIMKIGQEVILEERKEYLHIEQHLHAYRRNELNTIIHLILKAMHHEGVTNVIRDLDRGQIGDYYFGTNCRRYNIPVEGYEALEEVMHMLVEFYRDYKEDREKMLDLIDSERDEVFNKGIEVGRDLLRQLNAGLITMDDFNQKRTYRRYDDKV